ncbi:hypothetical protein BH23VER1_BH23VER1_25390 [soil metagenome]
MAPSSAGLPILGIEAHPDATAQLPTFLELIGDLPEWCIVVSVRGEEVPIPPLRSRSDPPRQARAGMRISPGSTWLCSWEHHSLARGADGHLVWRDAPTTSGARPPMFEQLAVAARCSAVGVWLGPSLPAPPEIFPGLAAITAHGGLALAGDSIEYLASRIRSIALAQSGGAADPGVDFSRDWCGITALVVDEDSRLGGFSPDAAAQFDFRPADLGRPIREFASRLGSPDIMQDLALVRGHVPTASADIPIEDRQHGMTKWFLRHTQHRDAPTADPAGRPAIVITFTDITHLKTAESALRRSEQRYRSLTETTNAIFWTASADGQLIEPQDSWADFTGMPYHEYRGFGWIQAVHPADREGVLERWGLATKSLGVYRSEQRIWSVEHQDYRHTVVRAIPIEPANDSGAQEREWVGMVEDVHDLRLGEDALRASEERLRLAMGVAELGMWRIDLSDGMETRGARLNGILGLEAKETTQPWPDFLSRIVSEDRERTARTMRHSVKTGAPYEARYRIQRPDGEERWIHDQGRVITGLGGQRVLTGALLDITATKRIEESLRQREIALRDITDSIPVFISVIDRDLRYEFVNSAYQGFIGCPSGAVVGRLVSEILGPETYAQIAAPLGRALAGEPQTFEVILADASGSPVNYQAFYTPRRRDDGSVDGIYVAVSDVTLLKKAEAERERSETQLRDLNQTLELRVEKRTAEADRRARQLRSLNHLLSTAEQKVRRRIAAWLHDDLQQNLTAAVMRLDRLGNRLSPDPQAAALAGEIAALIRQSISDVRSLSVELTPPILQHGGLPQAITWLADQMAAKHGLQVSLELDPHANPQSDSARIALFEAARECLFNIVKHSGQKKGRISLSCPGGGFVMRISDPGRGCPTDLLDRVRQEATTFGLPSLVERIEAMGGTLELTSTPQHGFAVELRIPDQSGAAIPPDASPPAPDDRAPEEPEAAPQTAFPQPARPGSLSRRVLIVDDAPSVRDFLVGIVTEQDGFSVVGQAGNGIAALALASELLPDLVVMDINMPVLNGIEATRRIRRDHPRIRIIGISANDDPATQNAVLGAGASIFLEKSTLAVSLLPAMLDCLEATAV